MAQAGQKQVKLTDLQPQQLGSLKEQLEAEVNALLAARSSSILADTIAHLQRSPIDGGNHKTCSGRSCLLLMLMGVYHIALFAVTSYLLPWPPPVKSRVTWKRYNCLHQLHRNLSLDGRTADTVALMCNHIVSMTV